MKFGTLRKALQTIESLEKHNHAILDDHINGFSPQYCKTLMQNLLSGQSPESYLSKIDKNSKKKVISPVNAVRYEILSRRIKGTIIDTNQMMPLIKEAQRF